MFLFVFIPVVFVVVFLFICLLFFNAGICYGIFVYLFTIYLRLCLFLKLPLSNFLAKTLTVNKRIAMEKLTKNQSFGVDLKL